MKIKGLKKAVGDYQRCNAGGPYSVRYGELMYNTGTGEIWTDEFWDIGHNSYNNYEDRHIVNLGQIMWGLGCAVTMENVKKAIEYRFG